MYWKKVLPLILFVVVTVLAAVGCSSGAGTTSATQAISTQPPITGSDNNTARGGAPGSQPAAPTIDYAAAAQTLGVTEQALRDALGDTTQRPMDFTSAAQKLGVSVEELQKALGFTEMTPPPSATGSPNGSQPKPPATTANQ